MNPNLNTDLAARLAALRAQDLHRQLRRVDTPQTPHVQINGREYLNFSSNDYLGLANHPRLKHAAIDAVRQFGAGSGASRLICGSLACHHDLEETLAAFKNTEAALTFSSGYATAVGAICALVGKDDVIILDKLIHASIVDAARLSAAKLRVFAHNDLNDLEAILRWADQRQTATPSRTLIITETVFSMDGDLAPLRELVALKEKYGAWLMIDEAHATGLFGENRRGLAEQLAVSDRIEIQMGTLGKSLGSAGGYIAGSRTLIDFLINRSRSFIFSTAPVPAAAAAARAAIQLVESFDGRCLYDQLWARHAELKTALAKLGWPTANIQSPIIPLIIGAETDAIKTADALREQGIYIPAIRYPTVARGQARLRLTITAAHTTADIVQLAAALAAAHPQPSAPHA